MPDHKTTKTVVVKGILDANDAIAQVNREKFDRAGTYVINMMSSPGAGKTTILERTLERLDHHIHFGVLEGDVRTSLDADRLERYHAAIAQVNTDPGFGGECHLDANMVRYGLPALPLDEIEILIIENVGNLVCPAEFRVGEDCRVMVFSVTEGEDKPLKYPLMFRSANLLLINKIDLLPHLQFDMKQLIRNLDGVNPEAPRILVSARTGEGLEEWYSWLQSRLASHRNGDRKQRTGETSDRYG